MMRVPFAFLTEQFVDPEPIFDLMRESLKRCEFTLGQELTEFEQRFADYTSAKYAIGVGSGTDALCLSLRAVGVGAGDEVITVPNSFIATTGAIVQAGATPVYVDSGADYNIDVTQIEAAITPRTKAILPVHWAGCPADMEAICQIAGRHGLAVIEDACQALGARLGGKHVGTFGIAAGFSCHPLKPLHVWGDGGVIVTSSDELNEKLRLMRNHGLERRDVARIYGVNSRFDTLQAIVGNYLFRTLDETIETRIRHARRYDRAFAEPRFRGHVKIPRRKPNARHVFHLYKIEVERRDELLDFLTKHDVEAKVHYPVPLHLQPAARRWNYREGRFPVAESESNHSVTLPCHQYLREEQIDYVIDRVAAFYHAT